MAKFCHTCKQSYADDQNVCPHCGAAAGEQDAGRPAPPAGGPTPTQAQHGGADPVPSASDSAVDLSRPPGAGAATGPGSPASGGLSGHSVIGWADLVQEPEAGGGSPVKVDSPSDADLLRRVREEEQAGGAGSVHTPTAADAHVPEKSTARVPAAAGAGQGAKPGEPAPTPADSAIDLGAEPPSGEGAGRSGSDVQLVGGYSGLASDVGLVANDPSSSVVDVGGAPAGAGDSQVSDVHLAPDQSAVDSSGIPEGLGGSNVSDVRPAGDSSIVLAGPGPGTPEESGIDLVVEDVAADVPKSGDADETRFGRDLIAEAVESGVDAGKSGGGSVDAARLDEPAVTGGGPTSSVQLGGAPGEMPAGSESSIDLGEPSGAGSSARSGPGPARWSAPDLDLGADERRSGPAARRGTDSDVDLGSQPEFLPEDAASVGRRAGGHSDPGLDLGGLEDMAAPSGSASHLHEGERPGSRPSMEEVDLGAAAEPEAAHGERAEAGEGRAGRAPARRTAWLGGTAIGAVVGLLAGFGLSHLLGGGAPAPRGGGPAPAPAPKPTFAQRLNHLRSGDLARAGEEGIEQIDENNVEELAARGEYRWLSYLQKQAGAGAKVGADDQAVKDALSDLTKAAEGGNPAALFWKGQMEEYAGKTADALKTYRAGAEKYKGDPNQKRLFDTAILSLELQTPGDEEGGAHSALPAPRDGDALPALILVGLQPPAQLLPPPVPQPGQPAGQPPMPPGAAPAAEDTEEAGFEFWQALQYARRQDYGNASKALDRARKLHERRRFTHLRRAQNPLSDPTEAIFLRCADELKRYWGLEAKLKAANYLNRTDKRSPSQALEALIRTARESGSARGGAAGGVAKEAADRLIKDKVIARPEDLPKGIDKLLAERKAAEDRAAELKGTVKEARDEAAALKDKVRAAGDKLRKTEAALKQANDRATELTAANERSNTSIRRVADELARANYPDARKGPAQLLAAVQRVIRTAEMKDPGGEVRKLQAQLARSEQRRKQSLRPEEMLALWQSLLQQDPVRQDLADRALEDAGRVLGSAEAGAAEKGRAELVRGLALRNEGKFTAARAALEKARGSLAGDGAAAADRALKQVSDPVDYYATQAETLQAGGKAAEAVALLNRALGVLPRDRARLLARRSLIELDTALDRSRGRAVNTADPSLQAARRDAAAAAQAGAAEGYYAAGRVAEETGQLDRAADNYRKAVGAHPALDAAGSRYRVALARVLTQPRPEQSFQPPPPRPKETRTERRARGPGADGAVLGALLLLQAPGLPADVGAGAQQEAEKLADEVLAAPEGTVPFDVRAQALAVKGLYTRALLTYGDGLRPYLPRNLADGLLRIIRSHPALRRPEGLLTPNPLEAEKHYAAGLNFFFARDYAGAEKDFLLAVENDDQDARYFYFLGLSRLMQGKRRDAYEAFDAGARLERQNRPAPAAVSSSLERVQGSARRLVNEARNRSQ